MWANRTVWQRGQVGLTLNGSISQLVVAAKDHVLGPHLDSPRRVWRSASDVCMGMDERNGGLYAIFVIPDRRHSRKLFLDGRENSVMIYISSWGGTCIGPTEIQI